MEAESCLEETVFCSAAVDENAFKYSEERLKRISDKIRFKVSPMKQVRPEFDTLSCAVHRDGRYIICKNSKVPGDKVLAATIKLNDPDCDQILAVRKKGASDIIQIAEDTYVFLAQEQHPVFYVDGKPVNLRLEKLKYFHLTNKLIESKVMDDHLWYPSKIDGSLQSTGMVYARVPIGRILEELKVALNEKKEHSFDASIYTFTITWPFVDISFVKNEYLVCLRKNGRLRTINLKDNSYKTHQLEGKNFSSVLAFSRDLVLCSRFESSHDQSVKRYIYKHHFYLPISRREVSYALATMDQRNVHYRYQGLSKLIAVDHFGRPAFIQISGQLDIVLGAIVKTKIIIVAKCHLLSLVQDDLYMVSMNREGKRKLRAFKRDGKYFDIKVVV